MAKYELVDGESEIMMHVFGKDLGEIFKNAGEGFSEIISETKSIEAKDQKTIQIKEDNLEELLVSFLKKLLYYYDTEQFLFSQFQIKSLDEKSLECEIFGEVFDADKHPLKIEVQAVSYRQLKIESLANGSFAATVTFDVLAL